MPRRNHNSFFQNKELNLFYIAIAIITFAERLISIFVPIYLYQLGYSMISILFYFLLAAVAFLIFSYPGAKIVSIVGVKHSILLSIPFLIIYYLGLRAIPLVPVLFYVLPFIFSLSRVFYNYGFHLNYITHSKAKQRGREVSFIWATITIATTLAPLFGGIIASISGFPLLYTLGALLLFLGTVPLFATKDTNQKMAFTFADLCKGIIDKKDRGNILSFTGYAIETTIGSVLWPIFLIIILISISKTGFVVTLSMALSLLLFYTVGKITDKYNKIKLLRWGTMLYFFAWIGRTVADTTLKIIFIDWYKNITEKVLQIPWAAQTYNLAIQRGYFRFLVGREVIFNVARVIFIPVLMLVFYINFYPFVISFLVAAIFSLGYIFLDHH